MRDRLIEKLTETFDEQYEKRMLITPQHTADSLLADGWMRPPCKVGQEVFFYTCVCDEAGKEKYDILEGEVISFSLQKEGLWAYCRYKLGLTYWHLVADDFGKTVFLTREEAEQKLKEGKG